MNEDIFLSYWPAWLALVVSALIAFNRLIDESKKFASFFGEWGRKRHEKTLRRHQMDLQATHFADAVKQAVENARKAWEEDENEAISALDRRLLVVAKVTEQQSKDIATCQRKINVMSAYADYESSWHNRMRAVVAASSGGSVVVNDLPPHMNFWQFEAEYFKHPDIDRTWWGLGLA